MYCLRIASRYAISNRPEDGERNGNPEHQHRERYRIGFEPNRHDPPIFVPKIRSPTIAAKV
jgi:hypothetical protein